MRRWSRTGRQQLRSEGLAHKESARPVSRRPVRILVSGGVGESGTRRADGARAIATRRVLVGGTGVQGGVDEPAGRHRRLDEVQGAAEPLMPMVLRGAAAHEVWDLAAETCSIHSLPNTAPHTNLSVCAGSRCFVASFGLTPRRNFRSTKRLIDDRGSSNLSNAVRKASCPNLSGILAINAPLALYTIVAGTCCASAAFKTRFGSFSDPAQSPDARATLIMSGRM